MVHVLAVHMTNRVPHECILRQTSQEILPSAYAAIVRQYRRRRQVELRCSLQHELSSHLQASTTLPEVKRHGSGAYFVAMFGLAPVLRMNSPMNSSLYPKPYTCGNTTKSAQRGVGERNRA